MKAETKERKQGLHADYVYGPVMSRRLGVSLGVNILPRQRKTCNFECPYCELGFTDFSQKDKLPTVAAVIDELRTHLQFYRDEGYEIDTITYAGNGEPTLHPRFAEIIDQTLTVRDQFASTARVAVLTNATRLDQPEVFQALQRVDERQVKLDAGTEAMFRLVDLPNPGLTLQGIVDNIARFQGDVTVQTMFVRGSYNGQVIDNTTAPEVSAWLQLLDQLRPNKVQLYSLDRPPAAPTLEKVPRADLESIAAQVRALGLEAQVF